MSDMHVIDGDGSSWSIVMHFTTPSGNNDVGVSWVTAVINSSLAQTTGLPDGDGTAGTIDTTEKANVAAGITYEHLATFPLESGGTTTAQLRTTLRTFYTAEKSRITAQIKRRLRYFGHNESEV